MDGSSLEQKKKNSSRIYSSKSVVVQHGIQKHFIHQKKKKFVVDLWGWGKNIAV